MPYTNAERQRRWRDRQRQLHTHAVINIPVLFGCGVEVSSAVKRTVRYLAVCPNPQVFDAVLRFAPDDAIWVIAKAAYNIERGSMFPPPLQGALFWTHRRTIATLASPTVSLQRKRDLMKCQNGGYMLVPKLIDSALSTFGNRVFEDTSFARSETNF